MTEVVRDDGLSQLGLRMFPQLCCFSVQNLRVGGFGFTLQFAKEGVDLSKSMTLGSPGEGERFIS